MDDLAEELREALAEDIDGPLKTIGSGRSPTAASERTPNHAT
jgi:hypothetical protein